MKQKRSLLTHESAAELQNTQAPPCLSLYQPTHRRHPENQQDPIRFRNLIKQLEGSLGQQYPAAAARELLEPSKRSPRTRISGTTPAMGSPC